MKTYLFHGPSGSGKDTQVEMTLKKYDVEQIATGAMFRTLYEEGDPEGIAAYEYWSKGIFNPAEQVHKLLRIWLKRYDNSKDWIFVSAVRGEDQIALFDETLKIYGRTLDKFIHFKLSEEEAIKRMSTRTECPKCHATYHPTFKPEKVKGVCDNDGSILVQREDDKPEKIIQRLKEYNRTIDPIVSEYKKRNILVEIDASPSIEDIHKEVLKHLEFSNER
jgi:adenylate kinase